MTLLAIWSEEPTKHVYIGTDSRLCDVGNENTIWDSATKIFQIADLPEVVAYCGKTEPLLSAIAQTAHCIRYTDSLSKVGKKEGSQLESRMAAACRHLCEAFKGYPSSWMAKGGLLIFAGFDARLKKPRAFRATVGPTIRWTLKGSALDELDFDAAPVFLGSGATAATSYSRKGKKPFDCLKSAILGSEPTVGGVPQVVRIDSMGVTPIGIVWRTRAFLGGMKLFYHSRMDGVEWRDWSFKQCEYPRRAKVKTIVKRRGSN